MSSSSDEMPTQTSPASDHVGNIRSAHAKRADAAPLHQSITFLYIMCSFTELSKIYTHHFPPQKNQQFTGVDFVQFQKKNIPYKQQAPSAKEKKKEKKKEACDFF